MKALNNNTQVLNIHYNQRLASDVLNKIFYTLFTAGVIEATLSTNANIITIESVSFLIHPQNQPDILVRIDTTLPISITNNSPSNSYLIARYRWENENTGAEFIFTDDANIVGTDVILAGLILDNTGNILVLNYDEQERARLKVIQKDTVFPLISMLDGYRVGHEEDEIPVSDGVLNVNLNAEYFNGKKITEYAVAKEAPIVFYNETSFEEVIETPTYPSWMDVEAVDKGEGITAQYLNDYSIQPQDGTTYPDLTDRIPVANTILQKELNAGMLEGYDSTKFAKEGHTHTLDELTEGSGYFNVEGMSGTNQAGPTSIEEADITYREITPLAYDKSVEQKYSPIYETGTLTLKGYTPASVVFSNALFGGLGINNPRIILQRVPAAGESAETTASLGKRIARIMTVSETGFTAQQMGSILEDSGDYIRSDAIDEDANQYYYFVIGEKIEVE
ncbi:MAG: hypothetical protein WC495_05230 [Patescibacteria group bacterium]|jgi:hypothetical protein